MGVIVSYNLLTPERCYNSCIHQQKMAANSTVFSVLETGHVDAIAFSWASIGIAVITAIFQGLVAALASMTESSMQWTFRFRLALVEHWWWTFVSVLLLTSLVMSIIAFTAGKGGDPVSVLALSSASFLAMVQYLLPAWQHREYVETRWLAWSGDSRTAIKKEHQWLCGSHEEWTKLVRRYRPRLRRLQTTPSDYYGWSLRSNNGIRIDPTDLIRVLDDTDLQTVDSEKAKPATGIYTNADPTATTVSFRWGREQRFCRRVSRAVSAMPFCLLTSNPKTADGYDGKGLAIAMGILGRNKGLQPWKLVFHMSSQTSSSLENSSTWTPRPAKVLRSFYKYTLQAQYGGLGEQFVNASVELALLMADVPSRVRDLWLKAGLEHQCLHTDALLNQVTRSQCSDEERRATLSAHYESNFVSMIISLNSIDVDVLSAKQGHDISTLRRPDVTCTGLLLKARGQARPSWWTNDDIRRLRRREIESLSINVDWRTQAAHLVGLEGWPAGLETGESAWA